MLAKTSTSSAPSILPTNRPFCSFLYSALCRSIVPGHLPQLQPDADTGATGHGSESPGSVYANIFSMPKAKSALFSANLLNARITRTYRQFIRLKLLLLIAMH